VTDPAATAPPTDPNRRRRAVIRVSEELIHDLLQLPPDVEVRWIADNPLRGRIDVMVTSPDLPVVEEGAIPPDLEPSYAKVYDRPVLVDTGIGRVPNATPWEWNYRYPDTCPTQFEPITEEQARRAAAQDLAVILLRRQPGQTEWTEAPA
jgi:hypothetical protein